MYGTVYVTSGVVKQPSAHFLTVTQEAAPLPLYMCMPYGWLLPLVLMKSSVFTQKRANPCSFDLSSSGFLGCLWARILSWFLRRQRWLLSSSLWICGPNSLHTEAQMPETVVVSLASQVAMYLSSESVLGPRFGCVHCECGVVWLCSADDRADWFLPLHSWVIPKLRFSFLLVLL